RLAVSPPRREPDARRGPDGRGRGLERSEALRKPGVEAPVLMVVPAIIKQERIDLHPARAVQLLPESVNHIQAARLVIGGEVAEIEPRIVMQKWTVRMGALALEVVQEVAAHLPWRRHAHHRRIRGRLTSRQR